MTPTPAGTRLRCSTCGTEVIVVKTADDAVGCCGAPMKPLES